MKYLLNKARSKSREIKADVDKKKLAEITVQDSVIKSANKFAFCARNVDKNSYNLILFFQKGRKFEKKIQF